MDQVCPSGSADISSGFPRIEKLFSASVHLPMMPWRLRNAEDKNLARGAKLHSKLLLVANVDGELVLDVGVLPFTSGTETAVKISVIETMAGTMRSAT
jgi:hypothetical protein